MPIVIGHNSTLNALASGFAAGAPGLAAELRHKQDQEREDARYKEQVARANELLGIQKAQEARAQAEYERTTVQQEQVRQGERALTENRISQITPQQTEAGYVQGGGVQNAMGTGIAAPTAFAAGMMQHHERILSHAREVAAKLPPELHERFFSDVKAGLEKDQQNAMLSKAQSDIENLGKDLATPSASGAVSDQLPMVQERSKALLDLLQQAQDPNAKPEDRAKILSTVQQAIHTQRADLIQTGVRRKRMAAMTATLDQQNNEARALALAPGMPPDIAHTLLARVDERQALLEMANLDPDITTEDLMRGWHSAGTTTVPRQGRGPTPEKGPDELKIRDYLLGLWKAQHPGKKDPVTGHEIEPGMPPPDGWLDSEAQRMRGIMGGNPLPESQYQPGQTDPDNQGFGKPGVDSQQPAPKLQPWESHPVQTRQSLIEEAAQDMATNGAQGFEQIVAKYGVEGKLPEGALRKIIQRAKALKGPGGKAQPKDLPSAAQARMQGQPIEGPF